MKWAERQFQADRDAFYESEKIKRKARQAGESIPEALSDEVLPVVANWGRWIVNCPCGNAEFAWKYDPYHICTHCWNAWTGRKQVQVEWPDEWQEIESLLDARPYPKNRNWHPGETVEFLRQENIDNDVE